jgi:putative ABC transport system permease protein
MLSFIFEKRFYIMAILQLMDIKKTYQAGGTFIEALKGVSLAFRKSEFVSILGPSGCGKTTLLNLIGGLDHYDAGDLLIDRMSTKNYKDSDWDAYRNGSIGFVFQSYHLIAHQTVLQNVEISMTLSGVSASVRRRRAVEALKSVGLSDQMKKKPNQLSGGQMQRVAIARALVNNPAIILADEPTGALDSHTCTQIMDILKEVSKTRLVIMVTHNGELAEQYSSRIIKLLDGEIQSDSNPVNPGQESAQLIPEPSNYKLKKTSMSLLTAVSLSFKNLLTKKGRTIITSIAGSIGIIGVALVLALSAGLSDYMNQMQTDALSGYPITVSTSEQRIDVAARRFRTAMETDEIKYEAFSDQDVLYRYDSNADQIIHKNIFTEDYLRYIDGIAAALPGAVSNVSYTRDVQMNLLANGSEAVVKFETNGSVSSQMPGMGRITFWHEMPDNTDFILSQYDLIGSKSRLPQSRDEIVLVVDEYNRIDKAFFDSLGLSFESSDSRLSDFIGETILKIIPNNTFYQREGDLFVAANPSQYRDLYEGPDGFALTIVGILRIKEDAASSYFSPGIGYTTALTDYVVETSGVSEIAAAQQGSEINVLTGAPFPDEAAKQAALLRLGCDTTPTAISIYPTDFDSKDSIKDYLDAYNVSKEDADQILYSDLAETITDMTGTLLDTVSLVLIGFAAISLLVSSIMIGIITYVSVIERTKEIGILRSVGARKRDISRVFNAETLIVGFTAGLIGVFLSYILTLPINAIIVKLVNIQEIAQLRLPYAVILIAGSMLLTLLAGLIPSRMAARKDPVSALRTE